MVTAKERYYYTYRPRANDLKVWDCLKWDQLGSEDAPVITYSVDPFCAGYRGECSCPAYLQCKHIKALQQLLNSPHKDEPYLWKWSEKHGWQGVDL